MDRAPRGQPAILRLVSVGEGCSEIVEVIRRFLFSRKCRPGRFATNRLALLRHRIVSLGWYDGLCAQNRRTDILPLESWRVGMEGTGPPCLGRHESERSAESSL